MKINEKGVLPTSDIFFHTASVLAKKMYFYPLCLGHYYCDGNYIVDRQSYNSFIITYVCSGNGYVEQDGKQIVFEEGSLAFVDCYKPHKYYSNTGWEIYWIHFDGILARQYFETATQNGIVLTPANSHNAQRVMRKMFDFYNEQGKVNEAVLSKCITDVLTELILCASTVTIPRSDVSVVEDTIDYITKNVTNQIKVEDLAKRAWLSTYYFIRVFKKETGFTPHEYIIRVRVDFAKFLLKTTTAQIKEIAYKSGFGSESSFCTSFKKACGVTPLNYRADKKD